MLEQLQTIRAERANGSIYCYLRQKIIPIEGYFNELQVQPLSKIFYLLLAKGSTTQKGDNLLLVYHNDNIR